MQKDVEETSLPTAEQPHSWAEVAGSTAGVIEEARPPKYDEKLRPPPPLQPEPQAPQLEETEEHPQKPFTVNLTSSEEYPTLAEAQERGPVEKRPEPERMETEERTPPTVKRPKKKKKEGKKEAKKEAKKGWDEKKPVLGPEPKSRIKLEFLAGATVDQMLKDIREDKRPKLVVIPSDSTVQQAIEILADHKILSAPIQDLETKNWLGLIDMFDLLRYVMKLYQTPLEEFAEGEEEEEEGEEQEEEEEGEESSESSEEESTEGVVTRFLTWFTQFFGIEAPLFEPDEAHKKKFFGNSIREVLKYSRYPKEITLAQDALMPQVISMFASGLRRIVMLDEGGQVSNIVSQYDVISYMYKHLDELGGLGELTLKELDIGFGEVYSVREYAEAVQGFYLMDDNHVSAVAVVNSHGKIIANLGVSDLRGLRAENFAALRLPVMEYLQSYASASTKIPPIVTIPTQTFQGLLEMFLENHVHRVWNVDKDGKVLGVVSLTDVMHVLDESW